MSRNVDWCLIVGPGEDLADLKAFLVPEASAPEGGGSAELASVEDLDELAHVEQDVGRVVLDGDAIELEDVGLVRRFVRRSTGFELVLCGRDPSRRAVRTLLAEPRTRWLAWPPDLDDLHALMRAPNGGAREERRETAPSPRRPRETAPTRSVAEAPAIAHAAAIDLETSAEELAEIEAILGTPPAVARAVPSAPSAPGAMTLGAMTPAATKTRAPERETPRRDAMHEELATLDEIDEEPPHELETEPALRAYEVPAQAPRASAPPSTTSPGAPRITAPAPYFHDQVADLANVAQKIELSVAEVREAAQATEESIEHLTAPLEGLTQDVARLLQFTRTLGYLVAPPSAGAQLFDLGELLEVRVRELVTRGPNGPRCLFRKNGAAPVRSDRQLVSQALDALFVVAEKAAGPGQIVRVQLRGEKGELHVTIEFPAGVLAGMDPERVLEPYALRRTMPEVGPNALYAAVQILRGQGGDAELARRGETRFEWRVRMPLASTVPDGAERPPSASRAEDPFA